jgi:5'-nucleotidase
VICNLTQLFTISEACLYSDLVEHLEDLHRKSAPTPSPSGQREAINVSAGEADGFQLSFFNLFEDVRATFHQMHIDGSLQRATLANLDKYVKRSNELPTLLRRLRSHGKATFLLTNSSWDYTDRIMSYLIDDIGAGRWVDLFAVVFVNASKPSFFEKGSTLREVDPATGLLRLTRVDVQGGRLGRVFQGGNLSQLEKILGSKGGDVLYVGDHIFGDVLRSRTSKGLWRTLLVVPELARELEAWRKAYVGYVHMVNLEFIRAETYRGKNSESLLPSNLHPLLTHMDKATDDFDCTFNGWFGSLFRRGPKTTFFGMQTARYADLYSSTCLNLLNYPMFYLFSPMVQLLVHEEHLIERIETYTASPMKSPQKSDEDE